MAHAATAADEVHYELRISNAAQHLAEVSAQFPASNASTLNLQLPVWRTGRYQILPLANGLRQLTATGNDGRALSVRKTDKASWLIEKAAGEAVTVRYELYANELGQRTRHIDDSHAYLDASAVWLYNGEQRGNPVSVQLQVPANWQSRSGMRAGDCNHCFVATNYDELVDSPIETGLHEFHSFVVDGKTIELAIWGAGNHDGKQIVADLQKLVATTGKLFGGYPFARYLFIVHATSGEGGATEHVNSTVIQLSRWGFAPRKDYLKFIRTATHEFFHTWNVKAYRPAAMVPYDYQKENYSELLWLAEGHTSYFDNLLTLRAGVQTRDEYLEEEASILDDYLHQPGRFFQSALESSFDEWIQPSGERARNASVSIYSKGELLALTMDLLLRQQSKGKLGIEDLHKQLWQHKRVEQGGYTSADVKAILKSLSQQARANFDWEQFWQDYVAGTKELPLAALLKDAGLQLRIDQGKDDKGQQAAWWGVKIKDGGADQFAVVSEVERDSPAWQAGLVANDQIVAIDQLRVSAKDFADRSAAVKSDSTVVTLFRRDQLNTVTLKPVLQDKGKRKLKALEDASSDQKQLNSNWLGVPWPKPAKD
ncbi:M61 family metallopeptidase [Permianibacter sp. IMCC34836]|uniref:M61 family metallopeptidase n=1 Tax=Permianibacter fluminis TaxID=2738515 RepID=UPI0015530934|nr:PDZ domain-containing protein [Permianibacter fluminis]NQD37061.1 M61 family metallopeptidase [Permianibacter fluminis]